jgi:TfoX/Sxy family transcriptional regulator of competence genes
MDAESLKALFEPFGFVTVRRMFGGSGTYARRHVLRH